MKAHRIWQKLEIAALDAKSFPSEAAEIQEESGTKQKDKTVTQACANALQLLVFECHPVSFSTPLTANLYDLWGHEIKFHFNCIAQNVEATTIYFNCILTNTAYGNIILYIKIVSFINLKFHILSPVTRKKPLKIFLKSIPEHCFCVKYSGLLLHLSIFSHFKLYINPCLEILQSWRPSRHNERTETAKHLKTKRDEITKTSAV